MQCPPVKITYSRWCRVCYKDWSRYLYVCCWHRWLCDSVIMNPFRIASYVNWHHFSKAIKHYELLHSKERARKQRKTGWNPDQHSLGLLQLSHGYSGIGHIFDMHRPIHTSIYMSTNTHRYICTERDAETGWRERQCRPGTSSAASPDVENKSGPLSTGIHPQTACPPRRPLALYQPPHIFCRLGQTSLRCLLLLHTQQAHKQHLAAANFNPTEEDEGEGEGRCRDAVWWRETSTVGRKERRRRCASGKPGSKQPDSGLAQEFPQSCSSPYLLLLLLRWSVCAFVLLCVCKRE